MNNFVSLINIDVRMVYLVAMLNLLNGYRVIVALCIIIISARAAPIMRYSALYTEKVIITQHLVIAQRW